MAFVLSWLLPPVKTSVYFHKNEERVEEAHETEQHNDSVDKVDTGFAKILSDLRSAYAQSYIVKWSVWVAFSTSAYYQVGNYIQPLWETILVRKKFQVII